jgi:hypothetical protein
MALGLLLSEAMVSRKLRPLLKIVGFALASSCLIAGLSACGKGFAAKAFDAEAKDLTGAANKNGVPFTGASSGQDLEILKQAIDPGSKVNLDFAASIESVVITRLDLAGNPVLSAPAKLQIRIQSHAGHLVTYAPVLTSSHEARSVTSKDDAGATKLNARCLDTDCAAVEVRISSSAAESGLIYRTRRVTVEALGPFASSGSTARLQRIGALASTAQDSTMITVEVAWGPAMFDMHAGDVEASGDLVATGGEEQNVSVSVKNETAIDGRLLGNSNHGDLLLRFADQSAWSFLRVKIQATPGDSATETGQDGSDSGEGAGRTGTGHGGAALPPDTTPAGDHFIPFDLSNPITAFFEKDKSNPVVQDEIKNIVSGKRMGDMQKFLNRAHPNMAGMVADLKTQALPPELVFITFVESRYFYSNYDISISGANAVGPWQFVLGTARGLGLKAFEPSLAPLKIVNGVQKYQSVVNPCDQRADLHLSTLAAAKYLRTLLNAFRKDPKLAVMAYNLGASGLNRRMNCIKEKKNGASTCSGSIKPLQEYDAAGIDYWEIRRLHAAPSESINYVPQFLAAQFVGREPSRYGFKVATTGFLPAPIPVCK